MDSKHCKKCAHTGPNNRSWKGGRTYHKAGYVMVLAPDHPRAGKGRYVLEHILVVERRLGRYLLPEERIHHKNNVRTDNRSRNLELWSTSHPTGARVRDLVRWAKEILQRYA